MSAIDPGRFFLNFLTVLGELPVHNLQPLTIPVYIVRQTRQWPDGLIDMARSGTIFGTFLGPWHLSIGVRRETGSRRPDPGASTMHLIGMGD